MDLDISEPEWVSRLKKKHQNVSDVLSLTDTPFERRDYRSPCAHGTKVLGIFHSSICRRALDDILQWAQIVGMGIESRRNTLWLGTGMHIYIYTYFMIYNSISVVLPKICWSCSCCPNNPIAAVFGDSWLGHRLGLEFFKGAETAAGLPWAPKDLSWAFEDQKEQCLWENCSIWKSDGQRCGRLNCGIYWYWLGFWSWLSASPVIHSLSHDASPQVTRQWLRSAAWQLHRSLSTHRQQ